MAGMRKFPYMQIEVDDKRTINEIGNNIHKVRMQKGISVRMLALQAGIDERQLYRIESAEMQAGIIPLLRIAKALDVGIDELLEGDEVE